MTPGRGQFQPMSGGQVAATSVHTEAQGGSSAYGYTLLSFRFGVRELLGSLRVNTSCVSADGNVGAAGLGGGSVHRGMVTAHAQSVYARKQSLHPVTNEYRPLVSLLQGYVERTVRKFARCSATV